MNKHAGSLGAFWSFVAGALSTSLLAAWIALCTLLFWHILGTIPDGRTSQTIQSLAWPFATILLAVPLLAITLLGGLRVLGQILSLKEFISTLPDQITSLEALSTGLTKTRDQFEETRTIVSEAAGVMDQSISQLADVEARLKRISALRPSDTPGDAFDERVSALSDHLERAKEIFDSGEAKLWAMHNVGVRRVRGWILDESVEELRSKNCLTLAEYQYILAALDIDRRTRRSGRSNLTGEDIARLDALKPH